MYCKRILILQQSNSRFAERNKELCGLVKLINNKDVTEVTVFVTNADVQMLGEWWVLLSFGRMPVAKRLSTLNNCTFTLSQMPLDKVSCLLIKREDRCYEAARAYLGDNFCEALRRNMDELTRETAEEKGDSTAYEQFVASTENFYDSLDVTNLKVHADERYKSIAEYSTAFERYYASGGNYDYYDSVRDEIGKVFVEFPPYYPLIRKYKEAFFVRIDFPSSEKFFVLGVLQRDGKIRYICYGLPAEKEELTDKDFVYVDNSPIAFWMLFQDATTGQISVLDDLV